MNGGMSFLDDAKRTALVPGANLGSQSSEFSEVKATGLFGMFVRVMRMFQLPDFLLAKTTHLPSGEMSGSHSSASVPKNLVVFLV